VYGVVYVLKFADLIDVMYLLQKWQKTLFLVLTLSAVCDVNCALKLNCEF